MRHTAALAPGESGLTSPHVPAVPELALGSSVFAGRYKVREKLGEGGMGSPSRTRTYNKPVNSRLLGGKHLAYRQVHGHVHGETRDAFSAASRLTMGWRIRSQLLSPVMLLLVGVAGISPTADLASARQARLRDAARFLAEESQFP
jgi:hypothetical protein